MIVVVAPAGATTGGPEALHQLVHKANQIEPGSGAICYYPFDHLYQVPEPYQVYNTPVIHRSQIPDSAVVVLPEIWPELAAQFTQRCALWWLSVDNFGSHGQRNMSGIDLHLFQSEYAAQYGLDNGFAGMMLTDYVNDDFIRLNNHANIGHKDRCVAVNPAKGGDLLARFREQNPDIEIREMRGLDRDGVMELLASSMVYIDFGHHPGRDRPPREAAMAKCVVFAHNVGSAQMWRDMCLPSKFKFDSIDGLGDAIREVWDTWHSFMANYDYQREYRSWIRFNERDFTDEVWELLAWARLGLGGYDDELRHP